MNTAAHKTLAAAAPSWDLDPSDYPGLRTLAICVGAQKTGTSWLHLIMKRHSQCHTAPIKELRFWDRRIDRPDRYVLRQTRERLESLRRDKRAALVRPWRLAPLLRREADLKEFARMHASAGTPGEVDAYLQFLMRGHAGEPVASELTPNYSLLDRDDFARMFRIAPDTRLIFLMRDPVSRLWSGIKHKARNRIGQRGGRDEDLIALFRSALADETDINRRRGDFPRTIEEMEAVAPPGRILYLFYEDLFSGKATDQLAEFLGVAPFAVDRGLHPNKSRRSGLSLPEEDVARARGVLAPVYDYVYAKFGSAVPASWRLPA